MFGSLPYLDVVVQNLAAIAAAAGLILNGIQTLLRNKQRRIEIATEARDKIHRDLAMRAAFTSIDFDDLSYPENFRNTVNERRVDRLLTHLDGLAVKYKAGLVSKKEMQLLEYEYSTTYRSHAIRRYLTDLDDLARERGLKARPYQSFDAVGKKLYGRV
ncbi:MAG: hypothetical protein KGP27_09030 [Hyphomicrobiales bacterium]|nr:hypothetical protein [Hyphomicrobiales bacterium]